MEKVAITCPLKSMRSVYSKEILTYHGTYYLGSEVFENFKRNLDIATSKTNGIVADNPNNVSSMSKYLFSDYQAGLCVLT